MNVLPFSSLMKEWILLPGTMKQFEWHQLIVIMNVLPFSSLMKEWILLPGTMKQFEWHLRTGIMIVFLFYGQIPGSKGKESIVRFKRQLRNP
jgi:hypothetical protein